MYILKEDRLLMHLKLDKGEIIWFENGFIHKFDKTVLIFSKYGKLLGTISFKDNIKTICFNKNIFLIEYNYNKRVSKNGF